LGNLERRDLLGAYDFMRARGYRANRMGWLPPVFYPGGELTAEVFGFNPNLRPVDAVRALPDRAFLFFHGGADHYVPVSNAYDLRNASSNPESRLVIVPGADHVKAFRTDPGLYLATLYRFLDQQISEHGG
jgi:fermentation-respiration switch protein FrsA (DUF1100 family)